MGTVTARDDLSAIRRRARVAAVLYLAQGIPAVFSLQYVPRTLIVRGDAAATVDRIAASETLFRLGIVAELLAATIFIFTGLVLYRMFERVDRDQAMAMLILVLVSVPISFVGVLGETAALALIGNVDLLSALGRPQRDALVLLFLNMHSYAIVVVGIFWGLWLFPLGLLVLRSGLALRFIGALLIPNAIAYVAVSLIALLAPQYNSTASNLALLPEALGEGSMLIWLFITGFRRPRLEVSRPG